MVQKEQRRKLMEAKIETKFDTGDTVFSIDENKIIKGVITCIFIQIDKYAKPSDLNKVKWRKEVKYKVKIGNAIKIFYEENLYSSIEELVENNLIE